MLVPNMSTISDYTSALKRSGFKIKSVSNLSSKVYKTWDISLKLVEDKRFWKFALAHGWEFVEFLKSFEAMKKGYSSKALIYGLIVAEK